MHIDTLHFVAPDVAVMFEGPLTQNPIVHSYEAVDLVMAEEASQE